MFINFSSWEVIGAQIKFSFLQCNKSLHIKNMYKQALTLLN